MATNKPRTNVKRANTNRSVRVAKKKQGVTKKQVLAVIGVLALVGVVAVVASQAAIYPRKVYIGVYRKQPGLGATTTMNRIATDLSSATSYNTKSLSLAFTDTWSLSPDKSKFIVPKYDTATNTTTLQVVNAQNGSVTSTKNINGRVSTSNADSVPQWFPDNKQIAYFLNGDNAVYSVNMMDASSPKKLIMAPVIGRIAIQPKVSSPKILYIANMPGKPWELRILDTANNNSRVVTTSAQNPSWSPSGKQFMYYQSSPNYYPKYDIVVAQTSSTKKTNMDLRINTQPTNSTWATDLNMATAPTVWSPGETAILFQNDTNGVSNLFYVDIKSKRASRVTASTDNLLFFGSYGWANDRRIVYSFGRVLDPKKQNPVTTVKSVNQDGLNAKTLYVVKDSYEQVRALTF